MAFKWIGKSADGNTVTLRRLNEIARIPDYATPQWMSAHADLIRKAAVIDVETTGLNRGEDKVIEIGLRVFQFNRENGDVLNADVFYQGLQDPGQPLTEEIKVLTGLTDAMVAGQSIDWQTVQNHLREAHIVIAHNAGFDRPFLDRYAPESIAKIWACTLKQIDWFAKGFTTQKLEVLSIYHGFFTDSHRALNDVNALTYLLSLVDETTGKTYFHELMENARRPVCRIFANQAPFESKDLLKRRGYTWDTAQRVWSRVLFKSEVEAETAWLENTVYGGMGYRGVVQDIPLEKRFSS